MTQPQTDYRLVAAGRRRGLKALAIVLAVAAAAGIGLYVFNVAIPDSRYQQAVKDFNDGKYAVSAMAFADLGAWKDSPAYLVKAARANTETAPTGGITWMGVFEGNPIGWQYFRSRDNASGLVAAWVVTTQPYNQGGAKGNLAWRDSSIRKWLNGTFLSTAFSSEQRKVLARLSFEPDSSEISNKVEGEIAEPTTTDTVTLLSSADLSNVPTHNGYTRSSSGQVSTYAQDWWLKTSIVVVSQMDGTSYNNEKKTFLKWAQQGSGGEYWYTSSAGGSGSMRGVRPVIYVKG
jgi:hypothetical protein